MGALASMAGARVHFGVLFVVRVALATVYFQEEFLDGGEGGPSPLWGPFAPGPPLTRAVLLSPPQNAGATGGCNPPITPSLGILESRRGSFMVTRRRTKVSVESERGEGNWTPPRCVGLAGKPVKAPGVAQVDTPMAGPGHSGKSRGS